MIKFKIGDRVRVAQAGPFDADTDVGQVGTVLEESLAPWVRFDEPTRYDPDHNIARSFGLEGWEHGHMDCINSFYLELVEEE